MHTYAWVYTRSGFHTRVCAKLCMVPHEWKQFRLLHRMTVFDNPPTNSDIHLQQLLNNCLEQLAPTTTFSNHLQQQHSATIFHSYLLPLPPTTTFNSCLHYIQLLPSTTTINYNVQQIPSNTIFDLRSQLLSPQPPSTAVPGTSPYSNSIIVNTGWGGKARGLHRSSIDFE